MLPTLPSEIWTRILSIARNEQDLPEVWMSRRFVSRAFRSAIESIFRDHHLRKTWITFHLGEISGDDESSAMLNADFEFSHLSEDKSLAHFKIEEFPEEYSDEIKKRLEGCARPSIGLPRHYVQIHRELNDTPIPNLAIVVSDLTLSCDWQALYTCFYGEEMLYTKYTKEWVASQEEWMKSVQQKVARGEMDLGKVLEQAIHAYGDNSELNRKRARRARMRRQWAETGEESGVEEDADSETKRMEKMGKARQLASMIDDSDFDNEEGDDDDEEEEDEEEEESEDDGWETDDSDGNGKEEDNDDLEGTS